MDLVLHADRLDGRGKRTYEARLGELPDGVLVERGGRPWLLAARRAAAVDAGRLRRAGTRRRAGDGDRPHTGGHGRRDRRRLRARAAPVRDMTSASRPGCRYPVLSEAIADTALTPRLHLDRP